MDGLCLRNVRVTYKGCGSGAQVGSPSVPNALESQRHQSSMTSPFPEHHSMLIIASWRDYEERHKKWNPSSNQIVKNVQSIYYGFLVGI